MQKKIIYAIDFDFTNGVSLANLRLRVQNQSIYKKKISGIK